MRYIASAMLLLLLVDGRPVGLRVVCWWKEGGNPGLDLCLPGLELGLDICMLKKKLLEFVTAGGGIHCHGGGLCEALLRANRCSCTLLYVSRDG